MVYRQNWGMGGNNKSPGSDGFTSEFLKFFWKDLKVFVIGSLTLVYMVYRPRDLYESDSSYIWYIGRVTSMKAIQAPMILVINSIIQLGQAMIKINFSYYL
jgi:hypothetical protein